MQNKFSCIAAHGGARKQELRVLAATAAAAATALGGATAAHATPAGLTFYPSTDIYGKGNIHFDADYFTRAGKDTTGTSLGLEYGLGPEKDGALGRTELGFDYVTTGGSSISPGKRLLFNIKTQLFNRDASGTRVVAGFWGVGSRGNIDNGESVFPPNVGYVVGSKNFSFGRLHLGVAHSFAKKEVITTAGGNDDRTDIQLGYDKLFAKDKFQFTADYYSGKSAISTFSPGLIYYPNNRSDFQIGYIRYNDSSLGSFRNQIYIGFDYNFGGGNDNIPDPKSDESDTKGAGEDGTTPAANSQP
ncbi:MAG: hypothetical protein ACR2MB_08990 [Acidimicrobiales bacterium]